MSRFWRPIRSAGVARQSVRVHGCDRGTHPRRRTGQNCEIRSWSAAVTTATAMREASAMAQAWLQPFFLNNNISPTEIWLFLLRLLAASDGGPATEPSDGGCKRQPNETQKRRQKKTPSSHALPSALQPWHPAAPTRLSTTSPRMSPARPSRGPLSRRTRRGSLRSLLPRLHASRRRQATSPHRSPRSRSRSKSS